MRVENEQLVGRGDRSESSPQGRNAGIAQFRVVTALTAAVSFVVVAFCITVLVMLTVHTNVWSDLTANHLDDSDYDAIAGDVLETDSIVAANDQDTIVFGSPVIIDGTISVNRTRADIESQLVAETITVFNDILLPDEPGSTIYRSLTETVVGLQQDCQEDELEDLRNQTETFRDQIINERTDLFECLEVNNATLVELQQNNTMRTTNHTQRLDDLDTFACDAVFDEAQNQTTTLNNLSANLTVINETNIRTSGKLDDLVDILQDIVLEIPGLVNASCVYNETTFNTTRQQLLDLRTVLNDTEALFPNITTAHVTCSAVLVNVTVLLDQYETILTESSTTLDGLNDTLVQYQSNYTLLEIRYTTLLLNVSANNASLVAFDTQYQMCLNDTADLQQRLNDLWTRYYTILNQTDDYQTVLDNINNQFNQTYTLFNATADQCDTAVDQFNELLLSYNTLLAQYQTNYSAIIDIINRSDSLSLNLTALISAIEQLETDTATLISIQSTWSTDLDTINSTLISIDASLTSVTLLLDNANSTLSQVDVIFTTLELLATQLNTTLFDLQAIVITQNTTLVDHDTRLDALEAFVCPNVTVFYQIADNFTAAENLVQGDVVAFDTAGEIVKANGLFIKDKYQIDAYTASQPDIRDIIRGVNTVPIDSSDHFYSMIRPADEAGQPTIDIDGQTFTVDNNVVIKFSPVHEILWTAYTLYTVAPGNSGPEITYLEYIPTRNSLFVAGSYVGDDEDSQVEFFNSDGRSSGLVTERMTPLTGLSQRISFFAELSATGQWLGLSQTIHNVTSPLRGESLVYGVVQYGDRVLLGLRTESSSSGPSWSVLLPGGLIIEAPNNFRRFSTVALFDLTTYTFLYAQQFRTHEAAQAELDIMDIARGSGDEAFVSLVWSDFVSVGTIELNFPSINGGNITISMVGGGFTQRRYSLVCLKLDIVSGLVYWVTNSNSTVNRLSTPASDYAGGTNFELKPEAEIVVDHFERPWIAQRMLFYNGSIPLSPFTFQSTTTVFDTNTTDAIVLFRLNPRNGNLLDTFSFQFSSNISVRTEEYIEPTSFVIDDIGDLFLSFMFENRVLDANGAEYPCPRYFTTTINNVEFQNRNNPVCTAIVKFVADFEPTIVMQSVFVTSGYETSFTIDSHGNLWSLLAEHLQLTPTETLDAEGFGIIKFGMHELEPLGVADNDALAGQSVRVVYSGEVVFPSGHGFSTGQNVFNDHGSLTTENVYGKTRMGVTTSNTTLVVDIHRARVTQQLV